MSYSPVTDFLALLRQTSGGVRTERMPGLDFIVAAMARAGMFLLSVGQTPPITNQQATVWLQPSLPSWVAEGTVYLWNGATSEYEPATPALWASFFGGGGGGGGGGTGYDFQSITNPSTAVTALKSLLGIQRDAPGATQLLLPSVTAQAGKALQVADFSTNVTNHTITLTPQGSSTIMREPSWQLLSTADQLAGITLQPSIELNAWVIV